MKFRDLSIEDTFDFVNDSRPIFNSFFLRCKKVSTRRYEDSEGYIHRVGSINAVVHHVVRKGD